MNIYNSDVILYFVNDFNVCITVIIPGKFLLDKIFYILKRLYAQIKMKLIFSFHKKQIFKI